MGLWGPGDKQAQGTVAALFLAAASGAAGAFLGFLFGIPRSQQGEAIPDSATGEVRRNYSENTNLEQISDWLTKIIVGLTLVQYEAVVDTLKKIGAAYGPLILDHDNSSAAAMAIIIYFFMASLLFVYLWTRIYVEALFKRQSVLLENELKTLIDAEKESIATADDEALQLADEFLDQKSDPTNQKFANIEETVAAASAVARNIIFERTRETRREAWQKGQTDLVAKTIPIFQGLIAAPGGEKHRHYGQLGYAIVKSPTPDWQAAKTALETALRLRGEDVQTSGTGYYEFNLAIVLIALDKNFQAGKKSDPAVKDRVSDLLDRGRVVIPQLDEQSIQDWAKLNNYKI
ncbi:MAG: hypothetical protein AAFU41_17180 [Pseudomonadota bacterium]